MITRTAILKPSNSLTFRLLLVVLFVALAVVADEESSPNEPNAEHQNPFKSQSGEEQVPPGDAVVFPWFTLCIGTISFLLITRFAQWLSYTTLMFIIGAVMGVAINHDPNHNILKESIDYFWVNINSEVLLLSFLPGLIFKDALSLDPHLFQSAFAQCATFAFPQVLLGTFLTALVAFYIFPYGWSFNLAMCTGAILSATDPVAVAALLDSLGAPARLKIHISGESLLNDGSAIVFSSIFSQRFLLELGNPEYGEEIGVAKGVAMFFQMSLGGVATGILFGLGALFLLWKLNRRLDRQENVVQTAATITIAYLCYFTADIVWGASGIIATLTLGVMINAFGSSMINDNELLEDFWSIVEHMLNTIVFTLGGLVWGGIIANGKDESPELNFTATDWGYLFILYGFLILIRYFIFYVFYPLTSNIGLKGNWRETFFQSFSGLRGSISIALALAIDNVVKKANGPTSASAIQTNKLFGIVGGIAFLTLTINATTCGYLLQMLGLSDSTEFRKTLHGVVCSRVRSETIDHMVKLLCEPWFAKTNFAVVRHHVSKVSDLKRSELIAAAKRYHNANHYKSEYSVPRLENFLPYLDDDESGDEEEARNIEYSNKSAREYFEEMEESPSENGDLRPKIHAAHYQEGSDSPLPVKEVRRLFLEVLNSCYQYQIEQGYLVNRELIVYILTQSVDMAADEADRPLRDWEHTQNLRTPVTSMLKQVRHAKKVVGCCGCFTGPHNPMDVKDNKLRFSVERCVVFLAAHAQARHILKEELSNTEGQLSEAEKIVLNESEDESRKAQEHLDSHPADDVEVVVSHKFCDILLNKMVQSVEHLSNSRLMKETEAHAFLEAIQDEMFENDACAESEHPGELPEEDSTGK